MTVNDEGEKYRRGTCRGEFILWHNTIVGCDPPTVQMQYEGDTVLYRCWKDAWKESRKQLKVKP